MLLQVAAPVFKDIFQDLFDNVQQPPIGRDSHLPRFLTILDEVQDKICVLAYGTGMSSHELRWSGGPASGAKLSKVGFEASKLSGMVVGLDGWTDVHSILIYLECLGRGLDDEARARLDDLVPREAILRLFRDLAWTLSTHYLYD
ncbi:hypothetical protein BGW39_001787 [Mortierella sp. 14UC]|nr:hypothetical protein BGW39_001787 [Mortierella sp. 14UC]